jgi:2-dehydropantoate 2-reductase
VIEESNLKILVLGAGGIGGYFGGRLAQAGVDVTFLVREKRLASLATNGLKIESQLGNATVSVTTVLQADVKPVYDLVMLTCKAYDLEGAMDTIAPAMARGAGVLPLLNGIAHLQKLNERFGEENVLGGTAKIAATLTPEGVVKHLNDWCTLTFGEQSGEPSDRVSSLKDAFAGTGVDAQVSNDIKRELWLKVVHLATVAVMTVLMRANVGEIVRTPDGKALFMQVLETNIEIARREGFAPDEAFIESYRTLFSTPDSAYAASLLRDIEKGGPIESDHILGFMLDRCRAHGLAPEIHCAAFTNAKAYEERRAAGRLP